MDGMAESNVGFSVARGNSQTENLALAFNAVHPTLNDKITLYASSINTKNDLATPSTVANLDQGGLRYDRNLNPKLFVFGARGLHGNALQFLDSAPGVYGRFWLSRHQVRRIRFWTFWAA